MANEADAFHPICSVEQLNHAACLEFILPEQLTSEIAAKNITTHEAFLINWHGEYHAYVNSCPHTHVSLNWTPNQFLDVESQFIQCSLHGAIFKPETGLCLRGPCLGQALSGLPIVLRKGFVCVDLNAYKGT